MKSLLKITLLSVLVFTSTTVKSQVLITLLLGESLNSDKVEFGLIGGINRSYLYDISGSEGLNNFNLGFYFHINLKGSSYLSTGVLVKSNVGATGMPSYPTGEISFDQTYQDAVLTKKIGYFYVPILFHQRFNNRFYIEGGMQPGLRNKASDIFDLEANNGDLSYKRDTRDEYKRLDFGMQAGMGYKFKREIKSMSTGVSYYYGLVNVSKLSGSNLMNSSVYFFIKIPIGAGKAASKDE